MLVRETRGILGFRGNLFGLIHINDQIRMWSVSTFLQTWEWRCGQKWSTALQIICNRLDSCHGEKLVRNAFYCCSSSSIFFSTFPARTYQLFNTDLELDLAASELWQSALKDNLRKSEITNKNHKSRTRSGQGWGSLRERAFPEKDITVRSLKITKYHWPMQQVKGILSCQP